jgi:multicomponent Na+:H+ antiporter subunit B
MKDLGSPVLRTVTRLAIPLTALMSVLVFLQGHDHPGGGFIAGVMAAAAGATYLLAFGLPRASRFPWWRVSVVGLSISVLTGTLPWLRGRAFLDHSLLSLSLPGIGTLHVSTAVFFDLGVYLIVFGTLMTIFVELGLEGR